jgi:hypothetical protein
VIPEDGNGPGGDHLEALAHALLSHLVSTPLAILTASLDHLEESLDPAGPLPRSQVGDAHETLDDARAGLDRLRRALGRLVSGLMPLGAGQNQYASALHGGALIVSGDVPALAAVCTALHGRPVTVCDSVSSALRAIERGGPFETILCDASIAAAWVLVRVARQEPPPRVGFLDTGASEPEVASFLARAGSAVLRPDDEKAIRAFVRGC